MEVNASNENLPMLGVYQDYSVSSGNLSFPDNVQLISSDSFSESVDIACASRTQYQHFQKNCPECCNFNNGKIQNDTQCRITRK